MTKLLKKELPRKRSGRKRKFPLPTGMQDNVEETVEVSPGKFEVVESGSPTPPVIQLPMGVSPIDYLEKKTLTIIGRIEGLAINGTNEDAVKLKANISLLNKIIPDKQRSEVMVVVSPYQRILEALEKEDNNNEGD